MLHTFQAAILGLSHHNNNNISCRIVALVILEVLVKKRTGWLSADPWRAVMALYHTQFIIQVSLNTSLLQSNLLASGANDSEIYIWDLNNFNNPMTPGAKSQVIIH